MALFCLRAASGVARPAIAALWPTRGERSHCVALDMGADIRADAQDLVRYAAMGSEYARIALNIETPRVALLNVGTEENKGRAEVREAADLLRMDGRAMSRSNLQKAPQSSSVNTCAKHSLIQSSRRSARFSRIRAFGGSNAVLIHAQAES